MPWVFGGTRVLYGNPIVDLCLRQNPSHFTILGYNTVPWPHNYYIRLEWGGNITEVGGGYHEPDFWCMPPPQAAAGLLLFTTFLEA
jgi:hypothetical protein